MWLGHVTKTITFIKLAYKYPSSVVDTVQERARFHIVLEAVEGEALIQYIHITAVQGCQVIL